MKEALYLDWNIFNKLEKLEILSQPEAEIYQTINERIQNNNFDIPYSNAHLNDLLTGYLKNPSYAPGHLEFIEKLTDNLCIVQYWKQNQSTVHYRDVKEFFQNMIDDVGFLPPSFEELMDDTYNLDDFEPGSPERAKMELYKNQLKTLLRNPVPKDFLKIYKADSIFELIYPRTKIEKTTLAMCDDMYKFSMNINKDYSLYKALRKFIHTSLAKVKGQNELIKSANASTPTYLTFDSVYEQAKPEFQPSENLNYDKLINLFAKLDLSKSETKGDEKFKNMFDDALHTFYAAHCNYFITIDKNCYTKAKEVYERLGIPTQVMFPEEFAEHLKRLA